MALYDKGLFSAGKATTAALASYAGESGAIIMDTGKKTLAVMDGAKVGGHPLAREDRLFIAGSDNVRVNGGTFASLAGDIVISVEGGAGGDDTVFVTGPEFALPEKVSNLDATVSFIASAESLLIGGGISHFLLTVDELGLENRRFDAVNNTAMISFVVTPDIAENASLSVSLVAIDNMGNKSPVVTQVTTVISVSVSAPAIIAPVNGSEVTVSGGALTVITSAFATSGEIVDTQKSADYQLMADADGSSIIAEALDSTDFTQHTFTGLSLTNGQVYYLRARHEGNQGGKSPWSAVVSFTASMGTIIVEGRTAYASSDGPVLEFFDVGTNQLIKLCLASAAKRKAGVVFDPRTSYVDYSLPNLSTANTAGTWYIDGSSTTVSMETAAALTETRLNQLWPANIIDPNTAKYNCDTLVAAYGLSQLPAIAHARGITHSNGQPFNIPNIQELMRIFCARAVLDSFDSTVADYPALSLTSWFNNSYAWASSEYNSNLMRCVNYFGNCNNNLKSLSYVAVPVLEI